MVDMFPGTLESVEVNGAVQVWFLNEHPVLGKAVSLLLGDDPVEPKFKLLLRPLSSATDEELENILGHKSDFLVKNRDKWNFWIKGKGPSLSVQKAAHLTNVLRGMGFDCDNLIPDGLALDSTN